MLVDFVSTLQDVKILVKPGEIVMNEEGDLGSLGKPPHWKTI